MLKLEKLSKKQIEELREHPAGNWAEELLTKSIFVTTQEGEVLEGEIVCVEPFVGNERGKQDDDRFRTKPRKQGEVLILDRYGNPMLFIVANGHQNRQEIVWIKELRVRDEEGARGKKMKFPSFLTKAGLDPTNLENIIDQFDGVQAYDPDPASTLHIDDPKMGIQSIRAGIKRAVTDVSETSLGVLYKG